MTMSSPGESVHEGRRRRSSTFRAISPQRTATAGPLIASMGPVPPIRQFPHTMKNTALGTRTRIAAIARNLIGAPAGGVVIFGRAWAAEASVINQAVRLSGQGYSRVFFGNDNDGSLAYHWGRSSTGRNGLAYMGQWDAERTCSCRN